VKIGYNIGINNLVAGTPVFDDFLWDKAISCVDTIPLAVVESYITRATLSSVSADVLDIPHDLKGGVLSQGID
jgi:hypothetical protein